jgi:hypothetical protein
MASNRRALCVGVNKYKNLPSAALKGCVPDAKDMSAMLKALLGFKAADVSVLTDAQATKANIMAKLKEMVDGAKAGKYTYLIFSLSSHGTQVPDTTGDEPDKLDEAFCPYDLAQKGDQWDPKFVITDDELRNLFSQLPSNVLLEVYLDTCHSGTGIRTIDLLLDRKPRFLPPPSLEGLEALEGKTPRTLAKAMAEKDLVHHILWAGCKSNQTSADAVIDGGWHGAFTYFFIKEMTSSKNSLPRSEVLKRVRAALKGKYTQIPQLETEATKKKLSLPTS